eukprot:tig00000692_g3274.t2
MEARAHARGAQLLKTVVPLAVVRATPTYALGAAANQAPVSYRVEDGVAIVTINNPPINALSAEVQRALFENFNRAVADSTARAIVVTGAGGTFSGGADVSFMQAFQDGKISEAEMRAGIENGSKIMLAVEAGPKPSVSAIDGMCLGGGLELSLGCSARVCTARATMGLPELKLGFIPGFGGTQRLPRVVGLRKGLTMMLLSEMVKAAEAAKSGLVDEVAPDAAALLPLAKRVALELADGKRKRVRWIESSERLEMAVVAKQVFSFARKEAAKRAGGMPQPLACIEAVQAGYEKGGVAGLRREADLFVELVKGPVSRALVHFFFAQRAAAKVPGVSPSGRPVRSAGVIGGGLMGSGIATALAMHGIEVRLKEVDQKFLDAGMKRIQANLGSRLRQRKITQEEHDAMLGRVRPQLDLAGFDEVDIAIEAVIESLPLKRRVFADLLAACSPRCVLATNTSTIDIDAISAELPAEAKGRMLGVHFFSPAHVMPLVEVVRPAACGPDAVAAALALCRQIKKTAVVVGNCVGFTVNRIFFPYPMAAALLADRGMSPYEVDRAVVRFGMPMGPFRMGDLVGLDVQGHVGGMIKAAYGDRIYESTQIKYMIDSNRLGEKTGAGYYRHEARQASEDSAAIEPILDRSRRDAGHPAPQAPELSGEEVALVCLLPVVNEACRVLAEGMVVRPSDIDVASVMGMGFPPAKGGVLKWASLLGAKFVVEKLREYERRFGSRLFAPSPFLLDAAGANRPLTGLEPLPAGCGAGSCGAGMYGALGSRGCEDIVVVAALRTPVTRARRGLLKDTAADDLLAAVLRRLVEDARARGLDPKEVGDVAVGCVLPKSDVGALNARVAAMLAGLPETVPVKTVNRLCSSGLQAIADVAAAIRSGQYQVGIAGGVESMSNDDMSFSGVRVNPSALKGSVRSCYMTMGQTSENVAKRFGVSREAQDAFAAESHRRAAAALAAGRFKEETVAVETFVNDPVSKESVAVTCDKDDGVSDGASAVLLMTRKRARELGMAPLASLRSFAVVGVDPSVMGIGPAYAIPAAVAKAGLASLQEVDVYEINEAFASQALYCVDKLALDKAKVNPNGGAIALGHPLGNTGSRLVVSLLHELKRRGPAARTGVVSMCIGTGMGAAAVFENEAHGQ